MKLKTLTTVLFCLLLSFAISAETLQGAGGVTLDAPSNWKQGPNQQGALLVVMAPTSLPNFHPNINVLKQNTGAMTADEYGAASAKQIKKAGGVFQSVKKCQLADGTVARQASFTFPAKGRNLGCYSVWVTRGKVTYLFTGTTLASDFENKKAAFEKISKTFRVPK